MTNPPTELNETYFTLTTECNSNYDYLEIYHKDKLIFEKDISNYICNFNSICEGTENYLTCLNDCSHSGKDDYCNRAKDDICDSDCIESADPDCVKIIEDELIDSELKDSDSTFSFNKYIVIILIIILVILTIYFLKPKKDSIYD